MRNIYIVLASAGMLLSSCTEDITDYNNDPKLPTAVPPETLVANAEKNLSDRITTISGTNVFRLWAQHWSQATYVDESNYLVIGRDPSQAYWTTYYNNVINDLNSAVELIEADEILEPTKKSNQLAIIETIKVYTYQHLVDLNGNIPYSESADINNLFPVYDDAETIYLDLISRISAAQAALAGGGESFGTNDIFYGGDVVKWRKLANSVKLRLGMRLADFNSTLASSTVSEAVNAGVFTSNDDNTIIYYESSPTTNINPIYNLFEVQNRREDYIAGETSVNMLTALNNPRLDNYFTDNKDSYIGGPIGGNNSYANYTHLNFDIVGDPTYPGSIMDYVEVAFFQAEAVERGFIAGDAEEFYNAGITASILYYGGTQDEVDAYLAQPTVAYATATGDYKQKIGTQKWISLFNRGFEAWTEYRRLDWPELALSTQTQQEVPLRMIYPVKESAVNGANYDAASSAIGGDNLTTPLFWDVN
ncbi:SusD/RagB family nutrient-binding outer membrane lipoprotein [Maribacter sp. IgM3_T14_3]|uniref:SusD/RagB family nutrient-binding outer membrane lipoprotein n=1 Tax=Maribacter sp. IgM3_T14_3 TaxID=3415140 RepID=UPI003C6ECF75